MATYRGLDGFFTLGGAFAGTGAPPKLNGSLIAGATSLVLDGNGAELFGGCVAGDTFLISGESGSPLHTVTGGPYVVGVNPWQVGITFTPGVAAGGAADNAALTFTSGVVMGCRMHTVNSEVEVLDASQMDGTAKWRSYSAGHVRWTGRGEFLLDPSDPRQKALLDSLLGAAPPEAAATIFGVATGKKWYGVGVAAGMVVTGEMGALVTVAFDFAGSGGLHAAWA